MTFPSLRFQRGGGGRRQERDADVRRAAGVHRPATVHAQPGPGDGRHPAGQPRAHSRQRPLPDERTQVCPHRQLARMGFISNPFGIVPNKIQLPTPRRPFCHFFFFSI